MIYNPAEEHTSYNNNLLSGNALVPYYRQSPEVQKYGLAHDEGSDKLDVWALGCILFEMTTFYKFTDEKDYITKAT